METAVCLSILYTCQHSFQNLFFQAEILKSMNDLKTESAKWSYEKCSVLMAHREAPPEKNVFALANWHSKFVHPYFTVFCFGP
jgi:hypothetical protein